MKKEKGKFEQPGPFTPPISRPMTSPEVKQRFPTTLHMIQKTLDLVVGEVGVTVRRGGKWAHILRRSLDLDLCLCSYEGGPAVGVPKHTQAGTGIVIETHLMPFKDVPARLVALEHEESSRTYFGLLNSMRKAYGSDFAEREDVTIFAYRRLT